MQCLQDSKVNCVACCECCPDGYALCRLDTIHMQGRPALARPGSAWLGPTISGSDPTRRGRVPPGSARPSSAPPAPTRPGPDRHAPARPAPAPARLGPVPPHTARFGPPFPARSGPTQPGPARPSSDPPDQRPGRVNSYRTRTIGYSVIKKLENSKKVVRLVSPLNSNPGDATG